MVSTANTPRARALGAELKEARERAGLTTRQLGAQLNRQNSHISRWETGRLAPSVEDTAAVLGILGVTGAERDRILDLARDASDPNWVSPGVQKHLAALREYERTASRITNVEPTMVPGLLQTADYAWSIMVAAGATRGEADQRVTYRMGRRDVLTGRKPVQLDALIGEAALRYAPCDRDVMVEQLRHLQKWSESSNITVQVIPQRQGYLPSLEGAFVLIEFDRHDPVVQIEHYRSATTITDRGDVQDYQTAADTLRREAMSPEESMGLIAETADEMERTP
ncbi:helix-turn-helix domain-containing protein [Haloechinothrix sp. YIM 98757]|uniref:Helix-turn-helix domain-containing protein n=1 Tax=Haloechinothrix aidingensis TaxID=2752311 RepID=A0A838AAL6_9PSEU|nr:helix-turn-helix transcriptional regulator [Haloechinothrix aidingensis]MBA0126268.1 helix-turn-helix domain-containing protein [Haloechinothrix aidingensis]